MLYSYLLVENQFTLETQPESSTREKRFAYSLYMNMLALMTQIASDITRRGGDKPLFSTRFITRISTDERVRALINRHSAGGWIFEDAENQLVDKIKESGLYKKFLKSEDPGSLSDEKIWQELFNTIIIPDPAVNKAIAEMENYSLGGVDRMRQMMEKTFVNFYTASDHLPDALKTLAQSMDKARELYIRLLDLPIALTNLAASDIEERRKKFLASAEDRNPNLRFVENELVNYLRHCDELDGELNKYGKSMTIDVEPMLRSLLRAIESSEYYQEYMEFPATDFKRDCTLWRNLYEHVIFNNPDFLEALEDKSVFWNDDIDVIGTFVVKTLRRINDQVNRMVEESEKSDESHADENSIISKAAAERGILLPMYKDEEDSRFGSELFSIVVKNKDLYRQYIDEALDKKMWESDRLAYMDIVILMTAIGEILNFPKIPLNVSVNEYIEIVKSYSTAKSGQFVHGLLSTILSKLRESRVLQK